MLKGVGSACSKVKVTASVQSALMCWSLRPEKAVVVPTGYSMAGRPARRVPDGASRLFVEQELRPLRLNFRQRRPVLKLKPVGMGWSVEVWAVRQKRRRRPPR